MKHVLLTLALAAVVSFMPPEPFDGEEIVLNPHCGGPYGPCWIYTTPN